MDWKSRFLHLVFLFLAPYAFTQTAVQAYPHYIGFGYQSCSNCHYNPMGRGPLTDYGRALGASTIAAKPFYAGKASDDELAQKSGFLGPISLGDYIRPSFFYRGLEMDSGLDSKNSVWRYITMQADANLVIKNQKGDIFASATLGYLPKASSSQAGSNWISREYYLAYRPVKKIGIYAGLMDVAYGIRVPDHNLSSRSRTLMAQNDQTDGVMVHWSAGKWEGAVHGFIGNIIQTADLRLKGVSATAEYGADQQTVFGSSLYYAKSEFRKRIMSEVHARLGSGHGSALLAEFGFIREITTLGNTFGNYIFLQEMYQLARGFNFLWTGDYYTPTTFLANARSFQVGPGLMYIPMQRVEFRTDLLYNHSLGGSVATDDTISWLLQLYLWL